MITDSHSGTRLDEIEDGIYQISTPVAPGPLPIGFSFNQYLVVDDQPLPYHTGPRRMFALTNAAVARILPVAKVRWIGFSHFEDDECGALNEFLAAAPGSAPLCGGINALINGGVPDRPPRALADGESLSLGRRQVQWFDTPHLPHAWECGHLFEKTTRTLFCGDLFTQGGHQNPPVTDSDVLAPSEEFRKPMDYWARAPGSGAALERLARTAPAILACMHGSAFRGDGAALLRALSRALKFE